MQMKNVIFITLLTLIGCITYQKTAIQIVIKAHI